MVGLASLSAAFNRLQDERRSSAMLLTLDEADKFIGSYLGFQYFPETVQDTQKVNYQAKDIPGASLPVRQWISGGDRTISFVAEFSCDVDLMVDPTGGVGTVPNAERLAQLQALGAADRNVDIRAAIVWLRRHMWPKYGAAQTASLGTVTTYAPRKVRLMLPNSGIGLYGGDAASTTTDSIIAYMTQCDVTFESFFPSGLPRLATVTLAFEQTAQYQGYVDFPSLTDSLDGLAAGVPGQVSLLGVAPYSIGPRGKVSITVG